jgi:hypothetical protein
MPPLLKGDEMIASWKTLVAGIIAIVIGVYHCISGHTIDLNCVWQVVVGAGLVAAKDYNVTGGNTPNTTALK